MPSPLRVALATVRSSTSRSTRALPAATVYAPSSRIVHDDGTAGNAIVWVPWSVPGHGQVA